MSFKAFKKIVQTSFTAAKAQDNNEQFNNQFRQIPFLNGIHIKGITVTSSTVTVEHKLGRMPLGYIITKQDASATIWYTSITDKFIVLDSSAGTVIDMWVF